MKNATFFLNNVAKISLALWDKPASDNPKAPNLGGSVRIEFLDGSVESIPMSAWHDSLPQNRRPNVNGCIDTYKLNREITRRNDLCGEDPIDNAELIKTDRSARTDAVDPKVAAAADRAQRVADLENPKKAVRRKSA